MCGNGIRVYARYLVEAGLAEPGRLRLATRTGVRSVAIGREGEVCVDMGEAAMSGRATAMIGEDKLVGERVDMGNPHLAVLVDELLSSYDLSRPPRVDPADFPDGVNVELVSVRGPRHLEMRVFERGVGETRSCGTGACAAAVAAAGESDVDGGRWVVDVPGGRLTVELHDDGVQLVGPAVLIGAGVVNDDWLAAVGE
jgi:diaminopimelate epimerase